MKDRQVFIPSEAVIYLAKERGIHMSVAALKLRRLRGSIRGGHVTGNTTLWTKEELDEVTPPHRGRRRGRSDDDARAEAVAC